MQLFLLPLGVLDRAHDRFDTNEALTAIRVKYVQVAMSGVELLTVELQRKLARKEDMRRRVRAYQ